MNSVRSDKSSSLAKSVANGLTTVALLKANFDHNRDFLGMFLPFVLDSLTKLPRTDYTVQELQETIANRHGLRIPLDPLRLLLGRARRSGKTYREGGRYFLRKDRLQEDRLDVNLNQARDEHAVLSEQFRAYAASQGATLPPDDTPLSLLLDLLNDYNIGLLMEDSKRSVLESASIDRHHGKRLAAAFILEVCLPNPHLTALIDGLTTGLVLSDTLQLTNIASNPRRFRRLAIYLDSGVVFGALGLEGEARAIAWEESLDLLKGAGADLRVFADTVEEMTGVLSVYEARLLTAQGKLELRPTPLTRHFLRNGYTSSDIRQIISLLRSDIDKLGIVLTSMPAHEKELTLDERDLSEHLQGTSETINEPRIVHDVNCTAGILTLRRGRVADELGRARAIFCSGSGWVVNTIGAWYRRMGGAGVPPAVYHRDLVTAAWLKRPRAAAAVTKAELVALCSAALEPSREVWESFLGHLRKLVEEGVVTTDEAVAVVATPFVDRVLGGHEGEVESETTEEIVARVKGRYSADADAARAEAARERDERRRLELSVRDLAERWSSGLSWGVFTVIAVGIVLGVFGLGGRVPAGVVAVLTIVSLVSGGHAMMWRRRIESMSQRRLLECFNGALGLERSVSGSTRVRRVLGGSVSDR